MTPFLCFILYFFSLHKVVQTGLGMERPWNFCLIKSVTNNSAERGLQKLYCCYFEDDRNRQKLIICYVRK